MNHRAVQRALFRMALDAGFGARLHAGEPEAVKDLGADERALLRGADRVAIAADREGRRRAQFLRNVSEEFALACAAGVSAEGFTSSSEFHAAVKADGSLPLAFGRYAERCCSGGSGAARALVALEQALARARRELRSVRTPGPGQLELAPRAWLVRLPEGTLDLAARLRDALDRGALLPAFRFSTRGEEVLLVTSQPDAPSFRLRPVAVERLSPALARLLEAALTPRTLAELARAAGEAASEIAPIAAELRADGVLLAGP